MTGVPAVTLKALASDTLWLFVFTVTVRFPTAALEATEMLAVNCVVVTLVMKLTVIPDPKLTCEKAAWKVVNWPLMTTLAEEPAWAEDGLTVVKAGTPARTEKPPVIEATSEPVVTLGVYEPMVAVRPMVILATAVLELV